MRVEEGGVTVEVPEQSGEGREGAVFFNPHQELNRDLTVAALRAHRERTPRAERYLDATAATGIRGVRAAADGWEVTCADVDPDAVARTEANLERNGLSGEVHNRDARALMYETHYDVVDVDPFGTPMPFADAAVNAAAGGLLCVTATDTAPLCGAHFESGVRSYWTVPRNTEYHAEMGVRVLLSALVRTAARYDLVATPVLTHATRHYVRTYLDLESGARAADRQLEWLGYVHHCEACLHRTSERALIADPPAACPNCGEGVQTAGPIWLGPTASAPFLARTRAAVTEDFGTANRARDVLATLAGELPEPTHYDQHRLCKRWGRSAVGMAAFLAAIRQAGYSASPTHYGGTTFKTPAAVGAIREATAGLDSA